VEQAKDRFITDTRLDVLDAYPRRPVEKRRGTNVIVCRRIANRKISWRRGAIVETDGTEAGTTLVKDINPGSAFSARVACSTDPDLAATALLQSCKKAGRVIWRAFSQGYDYSIQLQDG
jgi:hypothetical protein